MSTMPATQGHSEACCNVPPVVSKGYDRKGVIAKLGGYNTYTTGPKDASRGIIVIYDIFGFKDQTIQGADILSTSDARHQHLVLMPGLFGDDEVPLDWFPPTDEDKKEKMGKWFAKHDPAEAVKPVKEFFKASSAEYPEVKSWAVLGYCWGGKVVTLVTSDPDKPFKAGVECHPAFIDPAQARGINVPLCLLASKDESVDDVKKFEQNLTVASHVETFQDQIHGWMAARADLEDPRVKAEYTRGYETALKFLAQHL